jgi:hypothetical protein
MEYLHVGDRLLPVAQKWDDAVGVQRRQGERNFRVR